MVYRGVVKEDGRVDIEAATLPKGTLVDVTVRASADLEAFERSDDGAARAMNAVPKNGTHADASGDEQRKRDRELLVGIIDLAVDAGVSDLASQHDHYLYGSPKRTD